MTTDHHPKRTRGFSSALTDRIFTAALEILDNEGSEGLKIEAVAEKAAVHKSTLYRRYTDSNGLLKALIPAIDIGAASLPDTGTLQGDIRALVNSFAAHISDPGIIAINRLIIGRRKTDPPLIRWIDSYWREHGKLYEIVFTRAEARGEPVRREKFQLAIEMIVGPILLRQLVTEIALDDAFLEDLASVVYGFVSPEPSTQRIATTPTSDIK